MRRFGIGVVWLAAVWLAVVTVAAQGVLKAEDLDKIMKRDGPAQQALVKAVIAGNPEAAKTQLQTLQAGIAETQTFWVANKRTDAVEISKTVQKKLEGIGKLLAAPKLDSEATLAAVQDLNRSCTECHKIYRATDDDGRYILKPGSVPGV